MTVTPKSGMPYTVRTTNIHHVIWLRLPGLVHVAPLPSAADTFSF